MKTYLAVVDQSGDSAFGVWFPDVPGCFSAADQQEALLNKACEALALHLTDQTPPEARTLDAIRRDAEVQHALDAGAFLLAVPLVTLDHVAVRANISLDRGVLAAIDAAATARRQTRSAFLTEAALKEINGRH